MAFRQAQTEISHDQSSVQVAGGQKAGPEKAHGPRSFYGRARRRRADIVRRFLGRQEVSLSDCWIELRIAPSIPRSRPVRSSPIADARLIRNPVHLPSLSAIIRKRLFEMRHARIGLRPDESDQNCLSVDNILRIELALSILKLANLRRIKNPVLAVGPVQSPLMGLRIVQAQSQALDVPACTIGFELLDLGSAIPELARD